MWTVADLLRAAAGRGGNPALVAVGENDVREIAGTELVDMVRRLARGLQDVGVHAGDAVVLAGPNGAPWVIARLAIAAIGAVAAACDDQSGPADIAAIVADSKCVLAFASRAHAPAVRGATTSPIYLLEDGTGSDDGPPEWRALLADRPLDDLPDLAADAPAMIVYTSGTTGAPKSFVLTNANIAANLEPLLDTGIVSARDRILLPLPLHHVFPFLIGVLTTLAAGGCLVFPAAATGPQIAAALREAKVTLIVGVPRLYAALIGGIEGRVAARGAFAYKLFTTLLALSVALRRRGIRVGRRLFASLHRQIGPDLRVMVSGGAKLEAPFIWKLEGLGWDVLSGYGLAETASMFTGNLPGRKRIGSEGAPLGAGAIRIAEPDGEGTGEIQLKGANVFAGYRDNPAANEAAFTADGWFRTGDLGSLDAEGFLFVTGRLKEQIVLGGGKKVMPEELERHFAAHDYIGEVALLERDGKLVAIVVPDMAAIRAAGLTRVEDAVRIALAERGQDLPAYERIAGLALSRDALPRTRLGKYQRFRLAALYDAIQHGETRPRRAELTPEDRALIARSPARDAWEILSARYDAKGIGLESNLALDLGLDSLEWMTVAIEIEARTGLRVSEDMIARVTTVREFLAELTAAAEGIADKSGASVEAAISSNVAVDQWLRPPGPLAIVLGLILYSVNWLGLRLLFRLRASGQDQVPSEGAFVLIANHVSDLDPPAIAAALPWWRLRRIYWSGDAERLFGNAWGRSLARLANMFPASERSPTTTLANAKTLLDRKLGIVWFPESWRSPTGELQRFMPGIGMLLTDRPVTVVPAYIQGSFEALPRTRRWPRLSPISVTFGPPVPASEIAAWAAQPDGVQKIMSVLHDRIATMERAAKGGIS